MFKNYPPPLDSDRYPTNCRTRLGHLTSLFAELFIVSNRTFETPKASQKNKENQLTRKRRFFETTASRFNFHSKFTGINRISKVNYQRTLTKFQRSCHHLQFQQINYLSSSQKLITRTLAGKLQ